MGAGASLHHENLAEGTVEERTIHLFPSYMILDAVVTELDLEKARESWRMIVDDESPEYIRLKGTEGFHKTSCLTWFFDQFYVVSDLLDESSSSLYGHNIKVQIRALTGMINSSLSMFKDHDLDKVSKMLNEIAKGHATKGVKAFQYPIVGEIFMTTMEHCLGASYDNSVQLAWTKIFSVILTIVLPAAIREERLHHKKEALPGINNNGVCPLGNPMKVIESRTASIISTDSTISETPSIVKLSDSFYEETKIGTDTESECHLDHHAETLEPTKAWSQSEGHLNERILVEAVPIGSDKE